MHGFVRIRWKVCQERALIVATESKETANTKRVKVKAAPRRSVLADCIAWLDARTREDLDLIFTGGRVYVAVTVKAIGEGGELQDVHLRARIPRMPERLRAAKNAEDYWTANFGTLDRDKHADKFEDLETMALLSEALRDDAPEDTFPQHRKLAELISEYDPGPLFDAWERITMLEETLDCKVVTELTPAETLEMAIRIARFRNLDPLRAIASHARDGLIVCMAVLLAKLVLRKLCSTCLPNLKFLGIDQNISENS